MGAKGRVREGSPQFGCLIRADASRQQFVTDIGFRVAERGDTPEVADCPFCGIGIGSDPPGDGALAVESVFAEMVDLGDDGGLLGCDLPLEEYEFAEAFGALAGAHRPDRVHQLLVAGRGRCPHACMVSNKCTIVNAKPLYIDSFLGLCEAL